MNPNHLIPDEPPRRVSQRGVRLPATSPADHLQVRHLEKAGGWTRRERLRILWYRLRLTVQEMNYAARRVTELQAGLPEQRPPASNGTIA
jgi:hypothetical protein